MWFTVLWLGWGAHDSMGWNCWLQGRQPLELCTVIKVVVEQLHEKKWHGGQLESVSDLLLNAHVWASRGVNVELTTHV